MKFSLGFLKVWGDPWREYVSEFLGSALFVFLVSSVIVSQSVFGDASLLAIAAGIGFSYTCALYFSSHVSGGFLNPAVAISLWITNRLSAFRTVFYIVSQLLGSVAGAVLVYTVFGEQSIDNSFGAPALGLGVGVQDALAVEMILGVIFVFLVYAISINKTAPGVFGPLVYGLFLTVAALVALPVSGASVNLVRSFGPFVLSADWANLVVFMGAGIVGSLAGVVYEYVFLRRTKR